MADSPGPPTLTDGQLFRVMFIGGARIPDPNETNLFDPALEGQPAVERAFELLGTLGFRIRSLMTEYCENRMLDADDGSLEDDVRAFSTLERAMRASERIRARSCGARDHIDLGLDPTFRDTEEEKIADWFDREWAHLEVAQPGLRSALNSLAALSTELHGRALTLPRRPRGQPRTSKSKVKFVQDALAIFSEMNEGTIVPSASKEAGDRFRDGNRIGSERLTPFVSFITALCDAAGVERLKSSAIRTAISALQRAQI